VAIFFVFSTPKAVFMIFASELLAGHPHRACRAQHVGTGFSALSSLWAFCFLGEEQFETAFTHCEFLPGDIAGEIVN
jgi:chromate transport protein ChrA